MANLNPDPGGNAPAIASPAPPALADGDQLVAPILLEQAEAPAAPAISPATDAPPPTADTPPQPTEAEIALAAREQALAAREAELAQQAQQTQQAQQQLQYQAQQAARAQRQGEISSALEIRRRDLTAKGYREAEVEELIEHERGLRNQAMEAESSAVIADQIRQGRHNAAIVYSQKYGVPYQDISQMNSPQEMEAAGQQFVARGAANKRIEDLEARITTLTQGQVPNGVQYESGPSSASELSGEALEIAVGEGRVSLTPEVSKRLQEYYKSQGFR